MKRFPFLFLLALSLRAPAEPAEPTKEAQSFTLEQILSSPFPADLVAAPDAGAFAWTQNDRGLRSVWVAVAPAYRARAIFRDERDEGQELSQLRFGLGPPASSSSAAEIPTARARSRTLRAIPTAPRRRSGSRRATGAPRRGSSGKARSRTSPPMGRPWPS
ncbi:MAG TPA: hypothetical protein VJ921_01045 [Vicinamibacteria bacterium]|nr:hypothetical protein [Vicinamibacteria bacterium]